MQILSILLLVFIIGCALAVALIRDLLTCAVVFMGQSLALSIVWIVLESPDLGITEAAVGVGIDSILLFATLKKIHAIDRIAGKGASREEAPHGENPSGL